MDNVNGISTETAAEGDAPTSGISSYRHQGPLYRDYVWSLVRKKCARSYLEIGVRQGYCLTGVNVPSIGVDPFYQFNCNPIANKKVLHLFQMGSDEFFRDYDPRALMGGNPIDVAFLDGLHQFEFLLRDFINTERVCERNSLILLDDCLPVNVEMTERRHVQATRKDQELAGWWTGDVWKVVSILRAYRPDLAIIPFDTSPTGNVMVTHLDPTSTVLQDNYFEIMREYGPMQLDEQSLAEFLDVNKPQNTQAMLDNFEFSMYFNP